MKLHVAMPALVAPFGGEHSVGEGMIWSESHMRKRNGPGLVRPPGTRPCVDIAVHLG